MAGEVKLDGRGKVDGEGGRMDGEVKVDGEERMGK